MIMSKRLILIHAFWLVTLVASAQKTYTIEVPSTPMEIKTGHLNLGGTSPSGVGISVNSFYMELDGKPFIPVLGEFHYSRYPRDQWEEQILKIKAGGVNVIPTYVFWNIHEPYEGEFDWSGNKDLRAFIELCGKHGVWSIVRIGPFDHGEIRNGGLPDWLFTKPLEVRSNDVNYLHYTGLLYDQIAAQVRGLFYKDGGPVIGVQVENEHQHSAACWALSYPGEAGDYTSATYDASITMAGVSSQDRRITTSELGDLHMQTLLSMAKERGFIAPLYTATGWGNAAVLGYDGIPVTAGYPYPVWGDVNAKSEFCLFKDLHQDPDYGPVRYKPEDFPSFSVEMGAGIQIIYEKRPVINPKGAEAMIVRCLGSGANAIGYYMYQGGSSPLGPDGEKFLSDGNPKITYDFQAPLGEYGLEKPVYRYLRLLHSFIADFGDRLAPMQTVLPEGALSLRPDNRDELRYCIRTRDGAGFLFLLNFQDHDEDRHDMDTEVRIKTGSETIRIPVRLKKDEVAILPFNFKMGKAVLTYATAQPLMQIGNHYFFFAPDGMPTEFVFVGGKRFRPEPGFGSTFRYRDIVVTTLTRTQAEQAVKVEDKVLFTDATVLPRKDGSIRLLSLDKPVFDYTVYDGKRFLPFHQEVPSVSPVFEVKRVGVRRLTVHFTQRPEGSVHEYFLSLDYTGDVAIGFLENKVVADNLWQGTGPWLIGLERFADGMQRDDLGFYFRPLTRNAPFLGTIPQANIPDFGTGRHGGSVLDIRKVTILPEYKMDITL
jgi:beta-galactosidase